MSEANDDNPYTSPRVVDDAPIVPDDVWREGKYLIAPLPGSLPDRCLKCGRPGVERYSQSVAPNPFADRRAWLLAIPMLLMVMIPAASTLGVPAWAEPWVISLPWGAFFLVVFLLPALLGKRRRLEFSLCRRHQVWRRVYHGCGGPVLIWLLVSVGIVPAGIGPALTAMGYDLPEGFLEWGVQQVIPVFLLSACRSRFLAILVLSSSRPGGSRKAATRLRGLTRSSWRHSPTGRLLQRRKTSSSTSEQPTTYASSENHQAA